VQLFSSTPSTADVAAGADTPTLASNSFQLPTVPESILVWVQPQELVRNAANNSDYFFRINSLQVQAGTRAGLFSGATPADLWAMSQRNGADIPFWMFRGLAQVSSNSSGATQATGSGGPIIIDVARDLQLPEGVVPGMNMNWTFAVTSLNATNQSTATVATGGARIMIVPIMPGYLTNKGGSTTQCLGGVPGISAAKLKDAPQLTSIEYRALQGDGGFGGAIQGGSKVGDWFKHLGEKIRHVAWQVGDAVKHEAYKAGEGLRHAAYQVGDDLLDAAHSAAHSAGQAALKAAASGAGGRRMPAAMLYS